MLYTIIGIVTIVVAIIIIVYADRKLTSSWEFWVGVTFILLTFIGVPAAIYAATKNL